MPVDKSAQNLQKPKVPNNPKNFWVCSEKGIVENLGPVQVLESRACAGFARHLKIN